MKGEEIIYHSHEIPSDTRRFFGVILDGLIEYILEINLSGFFFVEDLKFAGKLLNIIAGVQFLNSIIKRLKFTVSLV